MSNSPPLHPSSLTPQPSVMRRRSLTTRLTLSHLLATLLSLVLLGGTLIGLVARSQGAQIQAALGAQAGLIATYAASVANDTASLGAQAATIVARFPTTTDVTVRVFAASGPGLFPNSPNQFPSRVARSYMVNSLGFIGLGERADRRYGAQPVVVGGQTIGVVEVAQSRDNERLLYSRILAALLGASVIATLGALALGAILARTLTRPLHKLGNVAGAIASGDLTTRSPDTSPDEIGQLAAQINTMAADLEARIRQVEELADARQQFYRSVSHELRTPLTAIRGMAENLEDDALPEQLGALQVIQTEAGRLSRLVGELLQPGQNAMQPLRQKEPFDFRALVDECCALLQPRAERGGVSLTCTLPQSATIRGDRDRLKQALLNLIDNALKWTPTGGAITLVGQAEGNTLVLVVRDTGPGIDPDLRDRVWQRGVHSADGGQGFGLALIREVVEAHGGTTGLGDGPGTVVELTLPVVAQNAERRA